LIGDLAQLGGPRVDLLLQRRRQPLQRLIALVELTRLGLREPLGLLAGPALAVEAAPEDLELVRAHVRLDSPPSLESLRRRNRTCVLAPPDRSSAVISIASP